MPPVARDLKPTPRVLSLHHAGSNQRLQIIKAHATMIRKSGFVKWFFLTKFSGTSLTGRGRKLSED